MKKPFYLFILGIYSLSLNAQTAEIKGTSKIEHVTVFLQGAQIDRTSKVYIQPGQNVIRFTGLEPSVQSNSVQVKTHSNDITLLSVHEELNYQRESEYAPRLREIKDSLDDIQFKINVRHSHRTVYQEEKNMLIANRSIGGQQSGVDVGDLMEMADFYRERLQTIETKILDIDITVKKLSETQRRLQSQFNVLNGKGARHTSDLIIKLTSGSKQSAKIDLSYLIADAQWVPQYDIRSNNLKSPVALVYKGEIFQNSGNDWDDVNLTLSTGNPTLNNTQPALNNWYLYLNQYRERNSSYAMEKKASAPRFYESNGAAEDGKNEEVLMSLDMTGFSSANFTQVVQSQVNTSFDIKIPYSIPSNGLGNIVEIQSYELPVSYSYLSIPKLDKDAFLLANVNGWGSYNLLPGNLNVFFESTFVGTSFLDPNITSDTLNVSMGRDKAIVVKREKLKDFCKNQTIGSNHKATRGYEIEVRNNKNSDIEIVIEDQLPLSTQKEISVELLESSNAKYNSETGKLTWKVKIPAGGTSKMIFKYQVKYPKSMNITNF